MGRDDDLLASLQMSIKSIIFYLWEIVCHLDLRHDDVVPVGKGSLDGQLQRLRHRHLLF